MNVDGQVITDEVGGELCLSAEDRHLQEAVGFYKTVRHNLDSLLEAGTQVPTSENANS